MDILTWIENLPVSQWVAQSDWGYPLLLAVHSIGMAAVVGLLLMLDARVLGFSTGISFAAFRRAMPYAWAGFVLNLISGVLLFGSTAHRLSENWAFFAKMGCIILDGGVTWLLWRQLKSGGDDGRQPDAGGAAIAVSSPAKALAALSVVLWMLAITFGRLIAYVMDHAILNGHG